MQPQIAKARTRLGQFIHPHPNRRVVSPVGPVIPRGPIQLDEPTRPPHADRERPPMKKVRVYSDEGYLTGSAIMLRWHVKQLKQ
jgi:hypothetical protein